MTAEPLWRNRSDSTAAAPRTVRGPSFDALYREHHPRLYRFCLGMTRKHAVAEDIAQETLLRAFLHRDDLDPDRSPWPWLKKVATRLVYDHSRSQRTVAEASAAEGAVADGAGVYADRELVRQMLGALPDRQRAAVTLRYLDDWKSAEIAAVLGLPRPAVEQLLLRARRSLKTEYRRLSGDRLRLLLWPLLGWSMRLRQRVARGMEIAADGGLPTFAATAESVSALVVAGALTVGAGLAGAPDNRALSTSGLADMRRVDTVTASAEAPGGAWAPRPLPVRHAAARVPSRPMASSSRSATGGGAGSTGRHVDLSTGGPAVGQQPITPEARTSVERDADDDELRASNDLFVDRGEHSPGNKSRATLKCDSGSKVARATCDGYDAVMDALQDEP